MVEKRRHERIQFTSRVKLMYPGEIDMVVDSRDLSHGGIFLFTADRVDLPVGSEVTVQDQDMGEGAPLVRATVVRVDGDGIALMFCSE